MRILILCIVFCSFFVATNAQLAVGTIAPEISLPNTNDSIVNLSSFKGKVVLIDFWASWCMPCRAAIPGVNALYKKYKEKGFEVFGVSIDSKKEFWLKAIAADKIIYSQVDDAAGWNSKVAELYKVDAIPASFLIDKDGKIILVNAGYGKLNKAIKKLLK